MVCSSAALQLPAVYIAVTYAKVALAHSASALSHRDIRSPGGRLRITLARAAVAHPTYVGEIAQSTKLSLL